MKKGTPLIRLAITAGLLLLANETGMAQPGSLDLSFSEDGKLATGFFLPAVATSEQVNSMALQQDGKIVVTGSSNTESGFTKIAVARYNATGALDNTFNLDGKVTTSVGSFNDSPTAIAIQADRKIVVAGYSFNGSNYDFAVVRYNANGTPDNTFSGDGILTTALGSDNDFATAIAIQADGKIVVAGYSLTMSNYDFAVVRYNANGTLDNTFSGDGKLTTTIGRAWDQANAIAIQANGKIVVAGLSVNAHNKIAVVRYNVNGTLDNTFSGNGIVTTSFGNSSASAASVAIQPDGKIIVVGSSYAGSTPDFAVVRYNINGSPDNTFSGDGKLTTNFGGNDDEAYSVIIQQDGKIVAAGGSSDSITSYFALARYKPNGRIDNTFSGDGKLTTAIGTFSVANALGIQKNGTITAAGGSYNGNNSDFAVVRYNNDGSLDNNFGDEGVVSTDIGANDTAAIDNGNAVAVKSNDNIVAVGTSSVKVHILKAISP